MKKLVMFMVAAGLVTASLYAQTKTEDHNKVYFQKEIHGAGQGIGEGEGHGIWVLDDSPSTMAYSFEISGDQEVVKNAPYTANASTERTQTLGDGNRIVNKSTSLVARDSQGRTRHEETLGKVGDLPMKGLKIISIHDPVGGTSFVFKSGGKTEEEEIHGDAKVVRIEENKKVRVFTNGPKKEFSFDQRGDVKRESLGTKTIEGVSAEGKRETRTIAAGTIGNERPIEITSETWYSPELHTVVLSKRNDPRVGETVFHLTDINRAEPDASLFQPPPGTKIDTNQRMKTFEYQIHPKDED